MILAHSIALDPTTEQAIYFARACGVARYAYNWALAEWKTQYAAGEKPSANKIKIKWNAHRKAELPWTYEVTKCASAQAIMNLGVAFSNFFRDLKKPNGQKKARFPRFKKKGVRDSFTLWNDQFAVEGSKIRVPNLGWVRLVEPFRFGGKIMGATVSKVTGRWFVSITVEVDTVETHHANPGSVVGIDLGISALMALSQPLPDGSLKVDNLKPRKAYLRRQKKLQRRISRQELARRKTKSKRSNRQGKRQARLSKVHYRVACIRKDNAHKATTQIANSFEIVVLENLNVAGMSKNHALAGAVLDASFSELRRQLEYKTAMKGGRVVLADRWFPSSKTCSDCGHIVSVLPLHIREWTCPECGCMHDRDVNAAKNLEQLVRPARSEPLLNFSATTHREIAALAVSQETVKLRSENCELNRGALVRTN